LKETLPYQNECVVKPSVAIVIFLDADICIAAGVTDDDGGFNISFHL
jgi:hypothetical protein